MQAVFALPDDPGPTVVSHLPPIINLADFSAICEFETTHPEIYQNARVASADASFAQQAKDQMDAFNVCFNGPHASEFKRMIEAYKRLGRRSHVHK